LRAASNPSNLAHCVAVGYEKMQVFNSSALRERLAESCTWLLPVNEPFRDLCARKWTEVAVSNDNIKLIRNSNFGQMLRSEDNADLRARDFALAAGMLRPAEQLVVSFNSDLCLELLETLPNVSPAKTEAILGFSNLRTIPMAKADYVWGWFQQQQNNTQQHCKKVVLRKDILNSALAAIEKAGATCRAVIIRPSKGAAYPITLLPDGSTFNRDKFQVWTGVLAWGLAALIAVSAAFVTIALLNQSQFIAKINDQAEGLTSDVKLFREKLSAEKQSQRAAAELENRKSNNPKRSNLLNALSLALPDGAFITAIRIEGASATIDGLAANPEELVSTLEASSQFSNVTFAGPVVHNPGENKSRFSLRMDVEAFPAKAEP
jgi:general secretion pathway protein L